MPPKLKLHILFTKLSIYNLCLCIPEEHNCLILTAWRVPKLRYYRAPAKNTNLSYTAQNHSNMLILISEIFGS